MPDERAQEPRRPPFDVGEDPDPRFTWANERTMLAWNRTSLALIAAGAAAAAFLRSGLSGGRLLVAVPLIVLGGLLAIASYRRWAANERAIRLDEPLPDSPLPKALTVTIAVVALITAVLAVVDQISS